MNSDCISRDYLPTPQGCPTWEKHIQHRIDDIVEGNELRSALAAEQEKRYALEIELEKLKKQRLNDYDTFRADLVQENRMLKGNLDRMNENAKKHTAIARTRSAKLKKLEGEVRNLKGDAKYRREMESNSQKCAAEIDTLTEDVKKHVAEIEDLKQNIYDLRSLFLNEVENGRRKWFLNDINEPDSSETDFRDVIRRLAGDQEVGSLQNTISPFSALVMERMRSTYEENLQRHAESKRISYHLALALALEPVRELLDFLWTLATKRLATTEDEGLTCRHIYLMCMYAESLLRSPIGVRMGHEDQSLPVGNDYDELDDCMWAWDYQLKDCLRNPNWSLDRTTLEEDLQRLQQTDNEAVRLYERNWFPNFIDQMVEMLADESSVSDESDTI